jgi:hypothetical protein
MLQCDYNKYHIIMGGFYEEEVFICIDLRSDDVITRPCRRRLC